LTSFCIEIDPSEQVVWLWKSPATYLPSFLPSADAGQGGGAEGGHGRDGQAVFVEREIHAVCS
jgi:hypothetical protein